jgi:glucan biosynthesis protein C
MERRYDIDWLRALAFALLIFYHTGMFFVPWDWHVKNPAIYEWLMGPMLFVNRWRMSLLFIISGMGTWFSLNKRGTGNYIKERVKMLLIPLVFGMLVVVPPQIYAERVVKGQFTGSYTDFWPADIFKGGVYPDGNLSWHHLWFLPYLLIFSLVFTPFFQWLRSNPENKITDVLRKLAGSRVGVYVFILPFLLLEIFADPNFPVTHALFDDWFYLPYCAFMYLFGYLLISVKENFWPFIEKNVRTFFVTGVIAYSLFLYIRANYEDGWARHITEALINQVSIWSWLLLWFGLAAKYLNRKSKVIAYANQTVYPFYIMHQTVTVLLAWWVMNKDWGFAPKFGLISIATFIICWVLYEVLIRRVKVLRLLFGVRL